MRYTVNAASFAAAAAVCVALSGLARPAAAYQFVLHDFSVSSNGTVLFDDPFNDGNPPPEAPNTTAGVKTSYTTLGSFGPESTSGTPGSLVLNSTGAAPSRPGFMEQRAILGRRQSGAPITEQSLWDLTTPGPDLEVYGMGLISEASAVVHQSLELNVIRNSQGNVAVGLALNINNVFTPLQQVLLAPIHAGEEIDLGMTWQSSDNEVDAFYQIIDSGVPEATVDFAAYDPTDNIFTSAGVGEAFFASTPTPEPATLPLLGAALGALAYARRTRTSRPRRRGEEAPSGV